MKNKHFDQALEDLELIEAHEELMASPKRLRRIAKVLDLIEEDLDDDEI